MKKTIVVLGCLALSIWAGWCVIRTHHKLEPDTRTAFQQKLFKLGVIERTVLYLDRSEGRRYTYTVRTDSSADFIYISKSVDPMGYKEVYVTTADGRLREHYVSDRSCTYYDRPCKTVIDSLVPFGQPVIYDGSVSSTGDRKWQVWTMHDWPLGQRHLDVTADWLTETRDTPTGSYASCLDPYYP